jgi:hypothetical protein
MGMGPLYGDLVRDDGPDLTRWEFYSAPFHIELADDLRAHLAGTWRGRDPR